jgi:outer membrane biogenesis lipoprotein LolB
MSTMLLLPLSCLMLLTGCSSPQAVKPQKIYDCPAWPKPANIDMQSGVAKYITRGHSAYKGCVANLEALRQIDKGETP